MIRRTHAAAAAILVALGMLLALVAVAPVAQAGNNYRTPVKCVSDSGVRTCLRVYWTKQADGDGVRLEQFDVTTPIGCGKLEGGSDAYGKVRPFWINPKNNKIDYAYDFGIEPCNFDKDLSNAGRDKGAMSFRFKAQARVDFGKDHDVLIGVKLNPNGSYRWEYALTAPTARPAP